MFLLDWDVEYPVDLDGILLIKKCSHDIRKKIDYFNIHPEELEEFPPNQLKRMYDDINGYENIYEIQEQLYNLVD